MNDLLNQFSEAAKAVSSSKTHVWDCVKQAYVDHLSGIDTDGLPEELKIFYDSVKLRVTSAETFGYHNNDEAGYIANDIMYLADLIRSLRRVKPQGV